MYDKVELVKNFKATTSIFIIGMSLLWNRSIIYM